MDANKYQDLAMMKEADQGKLHEWVYSLGPNATRIENGLRGLMDEVGELAGAIKQWKEYQQPLDNLNILEEVGDCLWRLSQICLAADITLEQAMHANLEKLDVRYKNKMTAVESIEENRDRKLEAQKMIDAVLNINREPDPYEERAIRKLRAEDDGVNYED